MEQESNTIDSSLVAKKRSNVLSAFSEDIWAVCIGGLLIVLILVAALLDIKFTTPVYQWTNEGELLSNVLAGKNILLLVTIGLVFLFLSLTAIRLSGSNVRKYVTAFSLIFILAILSLIIGGNKTINYYGIEYVVFALIIGLLLSNLIHLPAWIKEAARSEFFIKTGLIILGTSILFTDIIKA